MYNINNYYEKIKWVMREKLNIKFNIENIYKIDFWIICKKT